MSFANRFLTFQTNKTAFSAYVKNTIMQHYFKSSLFCNETELNSSAPIHWQRKINKDNTALALLLSISLLSATYAALKD